MWGTLVQWFVYDFFVCYCGVMVSVWNCYERICGEAGSVWDMRIEFSLQFFFFLFIQLLWYVKCHSCSSVTYLSGFLASDLNWCGQVEPPGINYTDCPAGCDTNNTDLSIFYWRQVSSLASTSFRLRLKLRQKLCVCVYTR